MTPFKNAYSIAGLLFFVLLLLSVVAQSTYGATIGIIGFLYCFASRFFGER